LLALLPAHHPGFQQSGGIRLVIQSVMAAVVVQHGLAGNARRAGGAQQQVGQPPFQPFGGIHLANHQPDLPFRAQPAQLAGQRGAMQGEADGQRRQGGFGQHGRQAMRQPAALAVSLFSQAWPSWAGGNKPAPTRRWRTGATGLPASMRCTSWVRMVRLASRSTLKGSRTGSSSSCLASGWTGARPARHAAGSSRSG
jgi:hypothetical protein